MFRNLIEKSKKNLIERKIKNNNFLAIPIMFLSKNVCLTLVSQINFFAQITFHSSHICYEKASQYKKFQKFNIKFLITMACSNLKNCQKMRQRILGINKG